MNESAISVRYAKALYNLALEQDKGETIYNDLTLIKNTLDGEPLLRNFLKSPAISGKEKKSTLHTILENSVDSLSLRFIDLITDKNREMFLYRIALEYIRLYMENKNYVQVKIISAVELNEKQIEILNKSISNQLNKEPVIETVVDKTLLGGYQLILGNKQLDHSVKRMLKDFNKLI